MLAINNIKPASGSKKLRKRIGRGNASGHGTYSGKGQKGQKSRSGVSNLKRLGMKQQLLQTPKLRGFKSMKPKNQVLNVEIINQHFKDKEIVSPDTLFKKKLIKKIDKPVKILGKEKLKVKVKFDQVLFNQSIKEQIK
jgi:large subunit ribosomal protein L15